ncbi:MAG: hypothetical protein KQ78_01824 [Candidatus Izimaplasma bacterium HR2]|nr:MAG: hypothetical protein KQ78_01824 [Candidatus Izimaplasma bacterium HR2]
MKNTEFNKLVRRLEKQGYIYNPCEYGGHKRFTKIIFGRDYHIYYEYLHLEKVWFPVI